MDQINAAIIANAALNEAIGARIRDIYKGTVTTP
jgi:hypothetical protein